MCKGLSCNNRSTLARAPGGQMQGGATQAMRCHRRGAPTQQMPARRRAPSGCGPQARWLRCSLLTYNPVCSSLAPCQRAWGPAAKWACYYVTDPNLRNVKSWKRNACLDPALIRFHSPSDSSRYWPAAKPLPPISSHKKSKTSCKLHNRISGDTDDAGR